MKRLFLMMASVLCTVLSVRAAINYDLGPVGFEDGQLPSGWTQENVQGTALWTVENASVSQSLPLGAKSGTYRAAIRRSSEQYEGFKTKLISPAFNLTQTYNPQLVFSHAQVASFDYFDTLRVYYRLNATAPWTVLAEYTSSITAWTTERILLPSTYQQGTAYQVAFEATDGTGLGVVLDDIKIFPTSQCQNAYIQHVTANSNSVTVGFGCNGAFNNFEVVITEAPVSDWSTFVPASATYYQQTDDYEVTVGNLQTYKQYYVYVRTDCEENESGYTDWVSETFRTTMRVELPFEESFNTTQAISSSSTNFGFVPGWTFGNDFETVTNVPFVYQGTTASTKNTYSVDSTQYLAFVGAASTSVSAIPAGQKVYAATPELNGNVKDYEVDFWGTVNTYFTYGTTDYASELTVGVMSDPTDFGTFTAIETVKMDYAYQFKHFNVSLASYTGNGKYVALASVASKPNVFFVDKLNIRLVQVATPTNVRAFNVLPTGFDVTAQTYGADSWSLKVATVYNRNASAIADSLCLVNQTGLTAATYKVALSEAMIAGKTVVVYVQTVKNGVASAWSFPQTIRVPMSGVIPMELTFNANSFATIAVKELGNEIHNTSTAKGVAQLVSPFRYIGAYPTTSSTNPVFDGAYLTLNGSDNYIVLPYLASLDSVEVDFRLSAGSATYEGASRVAIGVMTDPYDLSTFEELSQYDGPAGSFLKVRQDLSSYTGAGHFIAIRALAPAKPNGTYGSRNNIDALVVKKTATCYDAIDIKALPGAAFAIIRWNPNGMQQFLLKVYADATHTQLDTIVLKTSTSGATADSVVVTGLNPETTYYYSLQTICGTDTLPIEDYYSFTTQLGLPYSENFDAGIPASWKRYAGATAKASNIMAGTSTLPAAGTTGWTSCTVGSSYLATSGKSLGFNLWSTSKYYWAVMPELSLVGETQAIYLDFDLSVHRSSAAKAFDLDDYLMVLVSTDGGATWPEANARIWAADGTGTDDINAIPAEVINNVRLDLSRFAGQSIMIAFYGETTAAGGDNYISVDNVQVRRFDVNCQGITSLTATNEGGTAANIEWQVGGTQEAHICVTNAADNIVVFAGDVTTSPYHLTGLTPNTTYNVFAHQSCYAADTLRASFHTDCESQTIEQLGMETFMQDDALNCWHVGIGDETGMTATNVRAAYVNTVTGLGKVLYMNKQKNTSTTNYGNNYYAILPELTIDSIKKYQVVFDAATTTASSDTANLHKLYVGVITNPNDLATFIVTDTIDLKYAKDSTEMKTYVIGFDNYDGDDYGMYGTYVMFQVSAPNGYSDIAVIDNLRLEPVAGCHQIIDMEPAGQTSSSINFEWSGNAASYQVMLTDKICKPDTTTDYIQLTNVTNAEVTFTNLTAGTTYYAYVRGICAPGDTSAWSSFTMGKTAYGIPFAENFDEFNAGTYLNADWKTYNATVPTDSIFRTDGFAISNATMKMSIQAADSRVTGMEGRVARTEVYTAAYNGFLKSPAIDFTQVPEGQGVNLRFRVAMTPYSTSTASLATMTSRVFRVYVSEDGGETFNASNKIEWNCDGTGDYDMNGLNQNSTVVNIDLSDYAGKSVALGFYTASTVSTPDSYFYLDSISIDYYNNSCMLATKLSAATDGNNAAITWQNNCNSDVLFDLANDADFSNILKHDSIQGDSIYCSNLAFATTYFVRVRPVCSEEWTVTSFKTPYGLPFAEAFATTTWSGDWKRYKGELYAGNLAPYTGGWTLTSSVGGNMSTIHAYCSSYKSGSSMYSYLVATPEITLNNRTGNNVILSFDVALTNSTTGTTAPTAANVKGHTAAVVLSTDGGQTWLVDSANLWQDAKFAAIPSKATNVEIDLTQYAGQAVMVGFYHGIDTTATNTGSVYMLLDNIKINSVNYNCLAPHLTNADSTMTSVSVKVDSLSAYGYTAEISALPTFSTVLATNTIGANDSVLVFTDLAPSSTYYVHAKKLCGEDEESGWSDMALVHTACGLITELPWTEGFESYMTKDIPYCWHALKYTSGTTVYPYVYLTAGHEGGHSFYMYGGTSTYKDQTISLPAFDAPINSLVFEFAYKQGTSASYAAPIVGVMSDPTQISTFIGLDTLPTTGTVYQTVKVSLDAAPLDHPYITIYYPPTGTSVAGVYVDALKVSLAPQNETMRLLEAANVTRRGFDLIWEKKATCDCNSYQLVISPVALTDSALATATYITVDTTAYSASGLERGTNYYVYVRTSCPTASGPAAWKSIEVKTRNLLDDIQSGEGTTAAYMVYNSYGNSYSQTLFTAEELHAMGLKAGNIFGISIKYSGATASSLNKKQAVALGTTTKTEFAGYTPTDFVTASTLTTVFGPSTVAPLIGWISYEFSTPYYWDGESNLVIGFLNSQVDGATHTTSTGWATTGTSTSPAYRSVYRYKDSTPLDPNDLGGTSTLGNRSTTRPNIRFAVRSEACPTVGEVNTELVGFGITEAKISWTAADADYLSGYDVYYTTADSVEIDSIQPQYTDIDSLSLTLTGLNAETMYHVYVRAVCQAEGRDEGSSVWAMTTFTTNANCMPVKDLVANVTGKRTAEATWTKYIDEQDNNFRYVLSTTELDAAALAAAAPLADTTMHLSFDSLQLEQTYHLYVRSYCGVSSQSIWQHVSFTMPESCPAVADLRITRITANAVSLSWAHAPFAEENMWEVGIAGQPAMTQTVADTVAILFGLTEGANYTAYVKAICAEDDTSAVSSISFTTKVGAATECITVGDGTSHSYTSPFNMLYKNSWNQMVYSAEAVGQEGEIKAISFHQVAADVSPFTVDQVKIYMGHTPMDYATTTTDWVPATDLVEVFSQADFVFSADTGWMRIDLETPFEYNGTDNLVLVVTKTSQAYKSAFHCEYSVGTSGVCMYRQSDSDQTYGSTHPGTSTGTKSTYLPNVIFCYEAGGCQKVSDLEAFNITTNSASVRWYPGGPETSWETVLSTTELSESVLSSAKKDTVYTLTTNLENLFLDQDYYYYVRTNCTATDHSDWRMLHFITAATCVAPYDVVVENQTATTATIRWTGSETPALSYKLAYGPAATFDPADASSFTTVDATAEQALLSGLLPNTLYAVAVRAICAVGDTSRWSALAEFKTECAAVTTFPWVEDFNSYATGMVFAADCWENVSVFEPTTGSGSVGLGFKTATYTTYGDKTMHLSLPTMRAGQISRLYLPVMAFNSDYLYSFSLNVARTATGTTATTEGLRIIIANQESGEEQELGFISRNITVANGTKVPAETAVGEYTYTFDLPNGGEWRIIIQGESQYGSITYMDNFVVSYTNPNCLDVESLATANVTSNSADVVWHYNGGTTNAYVEVSDTADFSRLIASANITGDSTYHVGNLTKASEYFVRVRRECGAGETSSFVSTSFSTAYEIPYMENFETAEGWMISYNQSTYKWMLTTTAQYVLGDMSGKVGWFKAYYSSSSTTSDNLNSRLYSPAITLPELSANEALQVSWLMGATQYSTYAATGIDTSAVVSFDIYANGVWKQLRTWKGEDLEDIPWYDSELYRQDLTDYAGQTVKVGIRVTTGVISNSFSVVADSVSLNKIYKHSYQVGTCSSVDYQDEYFSINRDQYKVGTTTIYKKYVSGTDGAMDTLVVMNLTVSEATETVVYDTICEGYLYDRNNVTPFIATNSVVRPMFLTSVNGCDSLVTVNITVIPAVKRDTTIYACKGSVVEVNGKQYYTTTVVSDTLPGSNTCDSIVRTFIQFSDHGDYNLDQHKVLCKGDIYTDDAFPQGISAAGTYTGHVTTLFGCDSTVVLHISIAENGVAYDTITLSELPYVYAEDTILGKNVPAGEYQHPVNATCGEVTLYITVLKGDGLDEIRTTLSLSVAPNPAVVGEPVKILSNLSFGRDFNLMVYDAVGHMVYRSNEQSLTIPGMPVAGFYTVRLVNDGQHYQAKLLVK